SCLGTILGGIIPLKATRDGYRHLAENHAWPAAPAWTWFDRILAVLAALGPVWFPLLPGVIDSLRRDPTGNLLEPLPYQAAAQGISHAGAGLAILAILTLVIRGFITSWFERLHREHAERIPRPTPPPSADGRESRSHTSAVMLLVMGWTG